MNGQIKEIVNYGKGIVSEVDGSPSSCRLLLLSSAGLITLVWLSVVVGVAFFGLEWDSFSGALEWGKNLMFITILPYVSNKISGAIRKQE